METRALQSLAILSMPPYLRKSIVTILTSLGELMLTYSLTLSSVSEGAVCDSEAVTQYLIPGTAYRVMLFSTLPSFNSPPLHEIVTLAGIPG